MSPINNNSAIIIAVAYFAGLLFYNYWNYVALKGFLMGGPDIMLAMINFPFFASLFIFVPILIRVENQLRKYIKTAQGQDKATTIFALWLNRLNLIGILPSVGWVLYMWN